MNLKKITGFAAGPVISAALGIATLPIMAWVFPPAEIGRLNILNVITSFALLFCVLGLDNAYVREYHESTDKKQLLIATAFPGFGLMILAGIVTVPYSSDLAHILFADRNPWLYRLTVICCLVTYLNRFLTLIIRMEERGWAYSWTQIQSKIVTLVLLIGVAILGSQRRFLELMLIALAAQLAAVIVNFWWARHTWSGQAPAWPRRQQMRSLFGFALPLAVSGLVYWALSATGTVALRYGADLSALAEFSVANSFATVAVIVQSVFSVVWAPWIFKLVSQNADLRVVERFAQDALAIVCSIVFLLGALSWICDLVLPASYGNVKYMFPCMLLPPVLYTYSEITCIGITITRKTIYSLWATTAALITNVVVCIAVVPKWGATGAAVANAVGYGVFFVSRTEVSARIWRDLNRRRIYATISGLLLLCVAFAICGKSSPLFFHFTFVALLFVTGYNSRRQWRGYVAHAKQRIASRNAIS